MIDLTTVIYVALTGILWRMGGRHWTNPIMKSIGKDLRRTGAPLLTIGFLIGSGVDWPLALGVGALQKLSNHLGYGSSSPLLKRILTLLMIGTPALILQVWIGPLVTLLQFGGWYLMSRYSNRVNWALAEFQAGAAQGGTIAIGIF